MKRLRVDIERLVQGGEGLARLPDGRPCLIPGVIPGETVEIAPIEDRKTWSRGKLLEIVTASPHRVTPACPHSQGCGGCPLSHIEPDRQTRLKGQILTETLQRLAGALVPSSIEVTPSPLAWGYRHRVRFQIGKGGRLGFFRAGTHAFTPTGTCLLLNDGGRKIVENLTRSAPWRPLGGLLSNLAVVTGPGAVSGETGCLVLTPRDKRAKPGPFLALADPSLGVCGVVILARDGTLVSRVGEADLSLPYPAAGTGLGRDVHLGAPAQGFTQVNWPQNLRMVRRILELAAQAGARDVLDLYCGLGNFSIPMALAGLRVTGVEADPAAVGAAQMNAARLGLADGVRFECLPAEHALRHKNLEGKAWDLILLDPPRTGAREVCTRLAETRQGDRLLYVSCDPATLARDLAILTGGGYRLESIEAFDIFPQTAHVETLALMRRPPS